MVSVQLSLAQRAFVHEDQFFQTKGYIGFVAHWVGALPSVDSVWLSPALVWIELEPKWEGAHRPRTHI